MTSGERDYIHVSHNMADLVSLAAQSDHDMEGWVVPAEKLTPYAVEIRYPDDNIMPSLDDAREAFSIAVQIGDYVLTRISFQGG